MCGSKNGNSFLLFVDGSQRKRNSEVSNLALVVWRAAQSEEAKTSLLVFDGEQRQRTAESVSDLPVLAICSLMSDASLSKFGG